MKAAAADSCGLGAGRLEAQFLYFFVVILAIEDVPLLAAFEDGALLVLDLLAGGLIDSLLLIQQFLENLAHFQAYRIAIFDKVDFVHFGERVADHVRYFIHFVAADSHYPPCLLVLNFPVYTRLRRWTKSARSIHGEWAGSRRSKLVRISFPWESLITSWRFSMRKEIGRPAYHSVGSGPSG